MALELKYGLPKFQANWTKIEEIIAEKQGLMGSEMHSRLGKRDGGKQGCGAVEISDGSGSGSGSGEKNRLRLRLRLRVKCHGGSGSGSGSE